MKRMALCSVLAGLLFTGPAWATSFCLLTNGDFETGDLTGWTYDSAAGSAVPFTIPPVVTNSGLGNFPPGPTPLTDPAMVAALQGVLSGSNWIYQTFSTEIGKKYKLGGKYAGGVQASVDPTASAHWAVVLYPGLYDKPTTEGAGSEVAFTDAPGGAGLVFPWTNVSQSFTASTTEYTIALKWSGTQAPTSGSGLMGAYFDQFCVSEVPIPEPASLALLGLGLPLLRRRRH